MSRRSSAARRRRAAARKNEHTIAPEVSTNAPSRSFLASGNLTEPTYPVATTTRPTYPDGTAGRARDAEAWLPTVSAPPDSEEAFEADDVEILSGDVIDFADETFEIPAEETSSAERAEVGQDPWWETLSSAPTIPLTRPNLNQRVQRMTSTIMPFGLRERAVPAGTWRVRFLLLVSLAALVGLTAIVSVASFSFAGRLVRSAPSQLPLVNETPASQNGVIIQPNTGHGNPTPTVPPYLIGAWAASNAPTGGSVQVFVRVTHADTHPAGGIPVRLAVGSSVYGPVVTNAYGLATFTVNYGGGFSGYSPVFVTASASVGGQTITAQTSFAPR